MKEKICMTFKENEDVKEGDKITVILPHDNIERSFIVKKLDKSFKNLPVIEYNGKELVIDRRMIKKVEPIND